MPCNDVAIGVVHASTGELIIRDVCIPRAVYGPEGRVDVEGALEVSRKPGIEAWLRSIEAAGLVKGTGIGTGGWSVNVVVDYNKGRSCC